MQLFTEPCHSFMAALASTLPALACSWDAPSLSGALTSAYGDALPQPWRDLIVQQARMLLQQLKLLLPSGIHLITADSACLNMKREYRKSIWYSLDHS